MKVDIKYSIEDAIKELSKNVQTAADIIVLKAEDKFFIGGGCETLTTVMDSANRNASLPQNVSVCMNSPIV
jgi:hypothetical protein